MGWRQTSEAKRVLAASLVGCGLLIVTPHSAESALQFKKGTFNKLTTTGSQPIGGVGFQPKAIIFFWTRQNVLDTKEDHIRAGYGFATGAADERAIAVAGDHGVNPSNTGRWQSQSRSILILSAGTPTLAAEAELTSFDANGFTLNWITNEARNDIIHYIAIGGSDITAGSAGTFTKTPSLGNQSICGLGFRPDFVMLMSISSANMDAADIHAAASIGFFSAPRERGTLALHLVDNTTTSFGIRRTRRQQRIDRAFAELTEPNVAAAESLFDIVSFDPDGFTIDKEVISAAPAEIVHYLALRGGSYKVGSFNQTPALPAPQLQPITGVGFQPTGLILMAKTGLSSSTVDNEGRITFGASDGTSQGVTFWGDDSGANPVIARERTTTTDVMVHESPEIPAVQQRASLSSFNPDGFTLNWSVTDGTANESIYVAFGNAPNPQVNYRSIGTVGPYAVNTVTANTGSPIVTGDTTAWRSANRGRGDRIDISGVPYTILSVDSEIQLTLTTNYAGGSGPLKPYSITRQFSTLQTWENCVSNSGPCGAFPVTSNNYVADNRKEAGIVYDDGAPYTAGVVIDGSGTGRRHDLTLTVASRNAHYGLENGGVLLDNSASATPAVQVLDNHVTVEWLEIKGATGTNAHGIEVNGLSADNKVVLRGLLLHDSTSDGIHIIDADTIADIYNNVIYETRVGVFINTPLNGASWHRIFNNTVYSCNRATADPSGIVGDMLQSYPTVTLRNNIAHSNVTNDFGIPARNNASSHNLASDSTGTTHSPGLSGQDLVPLASLNFVDDALPGADLHITGGSAAQNAGADLDCVFDFDVDASERPATWDIGADDVLATTAVDLVSFTAVGREASILLEWETASELDNLGFHLYRAVSAEGPYSRITARAIPGLGSSPVGARYRYLDSGLVNGATYYYRLEDIETNGSTALHGPASAVPQAGVIVEDEASLITQGNPQGVSLRVVQKSRTHALLELTTSGFDARPQADGSVRLEIPGFVEEQAAGVPAIPVKRSLLDAIVGREVRIVSVEEGEVVRFSSLRPTAAGAPEIVASARGVVQARRRASGSLESDRLFPEEAARVVSVSFQGEEKKALVELAPLRWDPAAGELRLARRLTVRVAFSGHEPSERSADGLRGRRERGRESRQKRSGVETRLVTRERGVYSVSYEEIFGGTSRRGLSARALRLSRQGDTIAFHLEPNSPSFGPGSRLYFFSEGERANPYGREAVYELSRGVSGETMPVADGSPRGATALVYLHRVEREENHYYQAGLIEAPDVWLWDLVFAPDRKSYSFEARHLAVGGSNPHLEVWLQGASDLPATPDHHVRLYVNGAPVAEGSWDGKELLKLEADVASDLLREGENTLEVENLGDTGAQYSMVMLDRFAVRYSRVAMSDDGPLEGSFRESGTVRGAIALDMTEKHPRWLASTSGGDFGVKAGRQYLVVGRESVLRPEVRRPSAADLRSSRHAADYLVVGARELLSAAEPLLRERRRQGLRAKAVAVEDVYEDFGFGESRPEAIREFIAYAYHHWRAPSVRYVLLLGDATYDFKDYLGTGVRNFLPPLMVKTSYLWTSSDPGYAAVNGEDGIPDLAIGRLPARSPEEARAMVEKILVYENHPASTIAPVVLVADNPDGAGDFVSDAEEIAGLLSGTELRRIYLSSLGVEATRNAIHDAFDGGASLMSYLGHGGIHLWAQENLLDTSGVGDLRAQARQPLLLTLNCLNGYYHFPYFNSLSEELLKARDKGAIAAFSPSGLSLNGPAHLFHKALLQELRASGHPRLGDAVVAAQAAYAETGVFPELLSIYHLLGDPALRLK